MADVHGTPASRSASWHILFHDGVPRELTQSRGGDLRDLPKHRSSCSTVEEDLAAATAMDGSALPATDALRSYDAISKTPRAAGYRGSDFVLWHEAEKSCGAAVPSAAGGAAEVLGAARFRLPLTRSRRRVFTADEQDLEQPETRKRRGCSAGCNNGAQNANG